MLEIDKIYCGDCLELMKELPDKSVSLVLTDPPYGHNNNNNGDLISRWEAALGKGDHIPDDGECFMKKILNLNKFVSVKLTPLGKDILKQYEQDFKSKWKFANIDGLYTDKIKDDIFTCQLWRLMQLFGQHISMTKDLPFYLAIELDDDDLEDNGL